MLYKRDSYFILLFFMLILMFCFTLSFFYFLFIAFMLNDHRWFGIGVPTDRLYPVVRRADNAIHWIITLSGGRNYRMFEQPEHVPES